MSKYLFSLPSLKSRCTPLIKAVCSMALVVSIAFGAASEANAGPRPAGIVVDANTGKVLYEDDPDGLRYPASLTKMMTLYLVFEALESGRISLKTRVPVSKFAASQPPSKLGVRPGQTFTVEQGILALVTRSANDVATAFGEFLGGTEPRFGKMMTAKARALGMTRTIYHNAHGLPDPRQVTTARDQARLGVALRKHFPQYYHYFSTRVFNYGKQKIRSHNRLVGAVQGVDGIKTGFTRAAGFNLVTSAKLNGRSVVGVVLGGPSGAARDARMRKLIETYLPKASVRGNPDAFVSRKSKNAAKMEFVLAAPANDNEDVKPERVEVAAVETDIDLPANGPVPEMRYVGNNEVASANDASAFDTVPVVRTKTIKITKKANVASLEEATVPVPQVEVPHEEAKVDTVTTASTASDNESGIKGWVIQVGAAPGKEEAMSLLQKAQDKGGKVLRSAQPFTVAYSKGGEQLYRARFGGFRNQDAAVNACNALKRVGVSCWASQQ